MPYLVKENNFPLELFEASRIFCLTGLEFVKRINLTFTFTEEFLTDPVTPGTLTLSNLFLLYKQIMPIWKRRYCFIVVLPRKLISERTGYILCNEFSKRLKCIAAALLYFWLFCKHTLNCRLGCY